MAIFILPNMHQMAEFISPNMHQMAIFEGWGLIKSMGYNLAGFGGQRQGC